MIPRKLLVATAFAATLPSFAQETKVLFIGNSYTYVNNLPEAFRLLALSLGDTVTTGSSMPGGYTFELHSAYAPTLAAIHADEWNYVVLQEQSQIPSFPQAQVEVQCYPFAAQLVDTILADHPCAQPVFYMTWGRQNGDATNCDNWPPVCTYEGMQAELRTSYLNMAEANDAFCAPVGVAWKHVREAYPMLNLYSSDGSHPSVAGSYLVANVMYATMFRRSSVGSNYTLGLAADTALFLQEIASATVLDSMDVWNIGVNDPDAGFTYLDLGGSQVLFNPVTSAGEHAWLFPNPPYSAETSPTHQFSGPGDYSVTHILTDACGRADTVTQVVHVGYTGVIDLAFDEEPFDVRGTGSVLYVRATKDRVGRLEVLDALGRPVMVEPRVSGLVALPIAPGVFVCRIIDQRGDLWVKKVLIP